MVVAKDEKLPESVEAQLVIAAMQDGPVMVVAKDEKLSESV